MKKQIKVEPVPVTQIIHQVIIPETPTGLIGEKVVYNEKYLKKCENKPDVALPECGYFVIIKAVLEEDGRVMVGLYPYSHRKIRRPDGTDICLSYMKKYIIN